MSLIACIRIAILGTALWIASATAHAWVIKTTYGEDPVPPTRCYKDRTNAMYLYPGYGSDPVPAKTLTERWAEWREARGLNPNTGLFHRFYGPQAPKTSTGWPAAAPHGRR
ncbi:MAG: hypothetical protein DWQ37_14635 [Planctomycetota bacterium]|nr:MAG: hypothetical protein DWQ37_14635 [Planctomycetota bacterium]